MALDKKDRHIEWQETRERTIFIMNVIIQKIGVSPS